MTTVKLIEQGNGFCGVSVGAEVYVPVTGELMQLTSAPGRIQTDDVRGNYMIAEAEVADRDVTSLSSEEFAALPGVLVLVIG